MSIEVSSVTPLSTPGGIRRALLEDLPFLVLMAGFTAAALITSRTFGLPERVNINVSWEIIGLWTGLYTMPAILGFLSYGVLTRQGSLFDRQTWRSLGRWFLDPAKTLNFVVIFAGLPLFMSAFGAYKASIPLIQPFSWDVRFTEWDRFLHFGMLPWEILQPLLGQPMITQIIDRGYYLWFPILWMTVIWQAWHGDRNSETRSQFLVAFLACWILLGTVMAILLSSAGPVFFAGVTDAADPYAPLLEYLHAVNVQDSLRAVWTSDLLWQGYMDPGITPIEGISAMPSLHVSMAVLLVLLGFRVNRTVGWIYAAFAGLVLVGSIHLAWHYAVDGYLAAAGTVAIWWASGIAVRRWRDTIGLTQNQEIEHV